MIADHLAKCRRIAIDLATVQTNILVFGLAPDAPDATTLVAKARERGVLINAFGPRTVRAVTHLDVSRDECMKAANVLVEIASGSTA
jgi:threonine aldolase